MRVALTVTVMNFVVSSPSLTTSLARSVAKSVDSVMNPLEAAPFSKI